MSGKFNKFRQVLGTMDRRTVLGRGAAVVGGLLAGQFLTSGKAEAQARGATPVNSDKSLTQNTFTVSIAGETLAVRPFSMQTEPEFMNLVKLIRESDLSVAHLEMNFGTDQEIKWTPRGTAGGASYMMADPQIAKDLRWMGFHALSLAHNHSFDWGPEGIMATIKHTKEAGMGYAGTGPDLETARAPGYFEVDKGRIGMVSIGSGNNLYEWAGYGKGNIPGRPGMNPLRVSTRYEVPHAAAEQLKAVAKNLGVMSDAAAARKEFNISPGAAGAGTGTASFAWVDGDKYNITSFAHPKDVEANLRSVAEARAMSDFVLVEHHNSTSEGGRSQDPSEFVVDFARKTIDTGADLYVGHGWHTFLGIEIYKGKPIILGTGNFIFQTGFQTRIPADQFESYGYDMDKLVTLNKTMGTSQMHPGGGNEDWCWTALFQFKYVNRKLTEIILHPVEMGMDFSSGKGVPYRKVGDWKWPYIDGSPRLAYGANGAAILKRLQDRCALRGTKMEIAGGVGVIKVA